MPRTDNSSPRECRACGGSYIIDTPEALRGTIEPDAPEVDHIVPMSRGGGHLRANLQVLCRACNGSKGNQLESEWGIMGGKKPHVPPQQDRRPVIFLHTQLGCFAQI